MKISTHFFNSIKISKQNKPQEIMFSRKPKRKSSVTRVSNDSGLTSSLLAGDSLQMSQRQSQPQPKSFFNNDDDDDIKSESTATVIEEETFESVGYGWDFVIIIPIPQSDEIGKFNRSHEHDEIIQALYSGGLQTYLYNSTQPSQRICKIRAPLSRLRSQAELLGYILKYDSDELQLLIETGVQKENGQNLIKPTYIKHDPSITTLEPFEYIHDSYTEETSHLFQKGEGLNHPFSAQHRIKLILSIINGKKSEGGCDLRLDDLVKDTSILAYFPHHDKVTIKLLETHWLPWNIMPWDQPIDEIRNYFGEKIGLYFEFLGHYATWLLPLSIVGGLSSLDVIVEAAVYGSLTSALGRAYTVPAFCTFVSFWAQLMLEYWKRTEATKAMEWGMSEFENIEKERLNFEGVETISHINGKKILYFSAAERNKRLQHSNTIICGMILVVIACVGVIFYLKYYMVVQSNNETVNGLGAMTASILNAIQIQILNQVYHDLAVSLTDRENHRTDTEYEDALITKLFAFQFVNSYGSFFYIAFIKKGAGDPCQGSCMSELSLALAIIFCTRLFIGNAQEVLIPLAMGWYKRRQESKSLESESPEEKRFRLARESNISKAEKEFTLETYDPLMGSLEDYAELAIQYGYVTLFVAAFPLAPLLAYISNIVEIRTDGWKLLHAFRRALPLGAQDIGSWMSILQITSIISVITNAGIMCFTMDIFDYTPWGKLWIFIGFQYFIFTFMALFAYLVEDIPEEVQIQLDRQEFLQEKVEQIMQQIPDEEEGIEVQRVTEIIQINEADDEFPVLRSNHLD